MGQTCSNEKEPDTYTVNRSRRYHPGFKLCPNAEVCLIVEVTSQNLHYEGLRAGSIISLINGEKVQSMRDYQRLANPKYGSQFTMKVLPPEITGTYKLRGKSENPGILVDPSLVVSGVDDPKFGEVINRKVEMINGVSINDDFQKFRRLTAKPGPYFMTLSPAVPIPVNRMCSTLRRFNRELYAKSTEELRTWGRDLQRWKSLLDDIYDTDGDYSEYDTETEI